MAIDPTPTHGKPLCSIVKKIKEKENAIHCWVDADFCGLYSKEDPSDPSSVRSRTGFVITLGDNPIYFKSKLQSLIADSTMSAEYIATSTAMKSLIYLRRVHQETCTQFKLPHYDKSTVSVCWEDNRAAYLLATTDPPRMTPKSKSIAVHYHWFRQYIGKGTGIEMHPVASDRNRANILTKPLVKKSFKEERFMTMGF